MREPIICPVLSIWHCLKMDVHLQDLLDDLTVQKTVDDGFKCPQGDCQTSPEGLCAFVLVNVPPVVVIRLIRRNRASKSMIPVRFNMLHYEEEKERNINGNPYRVDLELISFVCHSGPSIHAGHYTTTARDGSQWFNFNNDKVQLVDPKKSFVSGSETVYLLVFVRSDCEDDILKPNVLQSCTPSTTAHSHADIPTYMFGYCNSNKPNNPNKWLACFAISVVIALRPGIRQWADQHHSRVLPASSSECTDLWQPLCWELSQI